MDVYLYEFDIDEYGRDVKLPCSLEEYLLKYSFFADTIFLQSSSSLKRQDVFDFFIHHPDLFTSNNNCNLSPLISFVLDPHYESLNHYIENRVELLENSSSGEKNIEKTIYTENRAIKKSIQLDDTIGGNEFKRRDYNVNVFFKRFLLKLSDEMAVLDKDDFNKGATIVSDYVLNNNFIQTFELREKLDMSMVNSISAKYFGKRIRECYFRANASAVGCAFHNENWKMQYVYLSTYAELIGLNKIFQYNWKLDRSLISTIKNLVSFQTLLTIYFNFESIERFFAFCNYVKSKKTNSAYLFYEFSLFSKQKKVFSRDMNRLKRTVVSYHEERG